MLTQTKAFCGCSTKFGNPPNSNVCPVCLGMPGVLPVLNKQLVEFAIKMGLATHCKITPYSIFARKNYFYPDLPKGYQISQFEEPICVGGHVEIEKKDGSKKKIGLVRIHMEEDAGKSIHDQGSETFVDLNRCGVPPTSRKFAGSPPVSFMMSIVAIASPAPLTMQPTLPSSLM